MTTLPSIKKIHTLGPAGTFSHEAAEKIFPKGDVVFDPNFDALFSSLAAHPTDIGVVPIENSLHGSIDEVLDLLYESKDVRIIRTHDVAIVHAFGALDPKKVTKVASHPQALRQCRLWLKAHFPHAEHFPVSSTAKAADLAKGDPSFGAISSAKVLRKAGLKVIAENTEGEGNTTRFAIISAADHFPAFKRTRMTVVLNPSVDRPGLLHALLTPFKVYDINITRIESRPLGTKFGSYVFYLDFLGNSADPRTKKVMEELRELAEIKVLGEW
ncbi:MAG: prephenate dehydratase domain-containing protein [Candidatus Peribacteraceae bacterium]|nr:prephenate dehydratase domain-containing protein [Candidatus Peribacteraceae bacterium]